MSSEEDEPVQRKRYGRHWLDSFAFTTAPKRQAPMRPTAGRKTRPPGHKEAKAAATGGVTAIITVTD